MNRKITLFLIAVLAVFNFAANAQNLIENWDGNGATGAGTSEAGLFGWAGTPTVTWGYANQAGTIRYMDNQTYTYNGAPWTSRMLCIRWDNVGGSTVNTVYSYPVTLEASKQYIFTGKLGWHNNAAACNYYVAINSSMDNLGDTLAYHNFVVPDKFKYYDDTLRFTSKAAGTYYLVFKNTYAAMGAVNDLSITAKTNLLDTLNAAYTALTLGDISNVTGNISLPSQIRIVSIGWTSSNTGIVSNAGVVTQPAKYNMPVNLTATLMVTDGVNTFTKTKVFTAVVAGLNPPGYLLANWTFANSAISKVNDTVRIADISGNNLVGKLINEAGIRGIGNVSKGTKEFNVLDLGNNKGYFDMGTEIGEAIYSLYNKYSICAYFRIDTSYKELNKNGNFLYTFSNAENQMVTQNGYIIGSLKSQGQSISTNFYSAGNQAVNVGPNAGMGAWHHFNYTQDGDSGRVMIDGVVAARGKVTNLPFSALPKPGLKGTLFNWLGRSNYEANGDVFLRKTLIYDFKLFNEPVSADDLKNTFGVIDTIAALNAAYDAEPIRVDAILQNEYDNLSLGDLSAVTGNLNLPKVGPISNLVSISWSSDYPQFIAADGTVVRPGFYNKNVTLNAILELNGNKLSKTFVATVLQDPATVYKNDLVVKYDFTAANTTDTIVTDAAEMHFKGAIMNKAVIDTVNDIRVLYLGENNGYFDMGTELGKALYSLTDFTIGCYYCIKPSYTGLTSNGNFLYSLSNSDKAYTDKNGYIFGGVKAQSFDITAGDYTTAQATLPYDVNLIPVANDSSWHHLAYTLSGNTGTLYIDGIQLGVNEAVTLNPSTALVKPGRLGTLYNWLGRSCYSGDVYLRKAWVYDFRIYKKALLPDEIEISEMKVTSTIAALNGPVKANTVNKTLPYKVIAQNGTIRIIGVTAKDKVAVYDLAGRRMLVTDKQNISVKKGVYIINVNGISQKVVMF